MLHHYSGHKSMLFGGCFMLYFDVVTYVETLDSLLRSELRAELLTNFVSANPL